MAIVAERFVERMGVVRIKYTNDDPTKAVPEPVDLFEMQGGEGDTRVQCCCEWIRKNRGVCEEVGFVHGFPPNLNLANPCVCRLDLFLNSKLR